MDRPHKHHFVPQFYLNGFTDTGDRNGKLYVLDRSLVKQWRTIPAKAACEGDLYEIESDGKTDPTAFEMAFSTLESQFAPVVQQVIDRKQLPLGNDRNLLLNFLTMMAVRVPRIKDAMEDLNDSLHKQRIREQIATTEGWESYKQTMRDAGGKLDDINEEELRRFIKSDDYNVTQGQNWYLRMMVEGSKAVLPLLTARKWVLRQVADDAPDLVCSDLPLTINGYGNFPKSEFMPGFALRNTLLIFPIHKRSVMVGAFEDGLMTTSLNGRSAANMNSATARPANQVYSSTPDYACLLKDGSIGTGTDILVAWGERRRDSEGA